jgi:hypothetical protein
MLAQDASWRPGAGARRGAKQQYKRAWDGGSQVEERRPLLGGGSVYGQPAKGTRALDGQTPGGGQRSRHGCWGQSRSKLVCAKTHPPPWLDWAVVGLLLFPLPAGRRTLLRLPTPTLDEMHALKRHLGPGLPACESRRLERLSDKKGPSRQRVVWRKLKTPAATALHLQDGLRFLVPKLRDNPGFSSCVHSLEVLGKMVSGGVVVQHSTR